MLGIDFSQKIFSASKKIIYKVPPEAAHSALMSAARLVHKAKLAGAHKLETKIFNTTFSNPFMVAAGFDKEGRYSKVLAKLGAGSCEAGTFTLLPQAGNPKPRLFRNQDHQLLFNRMGFNNPSLAVGLENIRISLPSGRNSSSALKNNFYSPISLGKGKETPLENSGDDYIALVNFGEKFLAEKRLDSMVPYWAVNISSPNTTNLRRLQSPKFITKLLCEIKKNSKRAVVVKLAPDFSDKKEFSATVEAAMKAGIDGLIINNTLADEETKKLYGFANQAGGLSGTLLRRRSLDLLRLTRNIAGKHVAIIASGGIMNPHDAWQRFIAGADMIQFYSGLVYYGPALFLDCQRYFLHRLSVG